MAKRKKNADDVWSRRQFTLALVNTGISVAALGASLSSKPVIVRLAPPPVQVLPQPVVARAITMPLEAGVYVYSGSPVTLRANIAGTWWEDTSTSVFQAKHRATVEAIAAT